MVTNKRIFLNIAVLLFLVFSCKKDVTIKIPNYEQKYLFILTLQESGVYGNIFLRDYKALTYWYVEVLDKSTNKKYRFNRSRGKYNNFDSFVVESLAHYSISIFVNSDTFTTEVEYPDTTNNAQMEFYYNPDIVNHTPQISWTKTVNDGHTYGLREPRFEYATNVSSNFVDIEDMSKILAGNQQYQSLSRYKFIYHLGPTLMTQRPYSPVSYYKMPVHYESVYKNYNDYLERHEGSKIPFNLKGNLTTGISNGFIIPMHKMGRNIPNKDVFPTITTITVLSINGKSIDLKHGRLIYKDQNYGSFSYKTGTSFFSEKNKIFVSQASFIPYYSQVQSDFGVTPPPKNLFPVKTEFIFQDTLTKKEYRASADLEYYDAPKELTITIDY